ncbi:MAG: micrococcal nuclease-like protein [Deltaproteobacteria bacterium]|nr:micrococcal nuclease-like protein [Deltaproteobacteria bacterium]
MKTFVRGLLFFFLLFLPFSPPVSAKTYQGQVIRVFDGDTILVRIKGHEEFVRLREIDAPEMGSRKQQGQEPWGRKAREFALSRLKDRKVRLETDGREERDAYGRLLAYAFVGDSFLNREMVQSGNAFFYRAPIRGKYAAHLEEAEEAARNKGIGVWDRKKGLKEMPRDFRARIQRDEGLSSLSNRSTGAEKKGRSFEEVPVPRDKIVGNQRTMVYHLPGSPYATRVSPKNRVIFNSAEEAEKAGFRKAQKLRIADCGLRIGKDQSSSLASPC